MNPRVEEVSNSDSETWDMDVVVPTRVPEESTIDLRHNIVCNFLSVSISCHCLPSASSTCIL
jgi:hypothetical protein